MKIVCLSVPPGDKLYAEYDYVGKLYRSLKRNTTKEFDFECITKSEYPRWWGKLLLFNPPERTIFLDLDTIVTGNVDFLLEYDGPFAILRDFYRPTGYGSAIMSIAPGYGKDIVDGFKANSRLVMEMFHGDQNWIEQCVPIGSPQAPAIWQDIYPGKIKSFKADNLENSPAGASIVCLHGQPKNHQLLYLEWVRENWR